MNYKKLEEAIAKKFIAWPLPPSVRADDCATKQNSAHRCGTNLLSYAEAMQMAREVVIPALNELLGESENVGQKQTTLPPELEGIHRLPDDAPTHGNDSYRKKLNVQPGQYYRYLKPGEVANRYTDDVLCHDLDDNHYPLRTTSWQEVYGWDGVTVAPYMTIRRRVNPPWIKS